MPVEHITIVGGGVAAWLSAAVLARKTQATVTVLETGAVDDSLGIPMAVESSLPLTSGLFTKLGIDELALVRETGGGFSLGRALTGWTGSPSPAFHGYGEVGARLGTVGFQHLVARLREEGDELALANYMVSALCAQAGRFALPHMAGRSVLSTMGYGINIETSRLAALMKSGARNVRELAGGIGSVRLSADGLIEAIITDEGEELATDLVLDCTGPSRLLAQHMPGFALADWSQWLPCNASTSYAVAASAAPPPYVHVDTLPAGWQGFAATQLVTAETSIFVDEAGDSYPFTSGRIAAPWTGNCLALGGAAAVIDPLAATQLHLFVSALVRLLRLFPHDRNCRIEAAEYNRQVIEEFENARDFAILHYKRNGITGQAFWEAQRAIDIPKRLAHKIALYESCGRVALHDEESFENWDWIMLFDALGIRPARYDVMADAMPKAEVSRHLQKIRALMLQAVGKAQPHGEFLRELAKRHAA
jgi:tryptophan halogenase